MDAVRLAAPGDAAELARLQHAFNTEFDSPTPDPATLTERYARLVGHPAAFALLAETGDNPENSPRTTGFATVTLRPTIYCAGPLAVLDELYVVPALRDCGIGTALLIAAIDEVRARGVGEMHINVDEIDVDTRRFYSRHGFVNIEPGTDYRMLLYVRELEN